MSANEKSSGILATQSLDSPNDDGASKAIRKREYYHFSVVARLSWCPR